MIDWFKSLHAKTLQTLLGLSRYLWSIGLQGVLTSAAGFVGGVYVAVWVDAVAVPGESINFLAEVPFAAMVAAIVLTGFICLSLCHWLVEDAVVLRWKNNFGCSPPIVSVWDYGLVALAGFLIGGRGLLRSDYCLSYWILVVPIIVCGAYRAARMAWKGRPDAPATASIFLPIKTRAEDRIGRDGVVDALMRAVTRVWSEPERRGGIIGLRGENGSGKTSVINLLLGRLEADPKKIVIFVDTWPIHGAASMQRHLLHEISAGISRYYNASDFTDAIRSYAFIAEHGWPTANGIISRFLGSEAVTLDKKARQLAKVLQRIDHEVLVVVDDLDRLLPDELYSLMRTIDYLRGIPKTAFLLAYDPKITPKKFEVASAGGAPIQ